MKRDLDLIRLILLEAENNADPQNWFDPEPVGYETEAVSYHVMLMEQAGLIEGWNRSAIGGFPGQLEISPGVAMSSWRR